MRRALRVDRVGCWQRAKACGTVTLGYDDRHRRRVRLATDAGEAFLLDLPRAVMLEEGDGLALDDGNWLEVKAAAEPLLEIRAGLAEVLGRLAWHIGNRHLPAQIFEDRILIRQDHVIAEMLQGLGASLRQLNAPFNPERGAYDGHEHGH
jgi:urease accessory protein